MAAAMLKKFNVSSIRLLANNPQKIQDLEKAGLKIEQRIPIEIPPNRFNRHYLEIEEGKFGAPPFTQI